MNLFSFNNTDRTLNLCVHILAFNYLLCEIPTTVTSSTSSSLDNSPPGAQRELGENVSVFPCDNNQVYSFTVFSVCSPVSFISTQ